MTERERLIELLRNAEVEELEAIKMNPFTYSSTDFTADYLLANGVIVPPCKVGDVVYQRDAAGRIYESKIKSIIYDTDCIAFDKRAIGKTVFLTREEAEKALEGLKNEK